MTEQDTLSPENVIAPSAEIAEVEIRIMSDLALLRQTAGRETMQVEAMAMHNAALAVLRPDIGVDGVRRMLRLAGAENDRIEARDRDAAEISKRRRAAAKRRAGTAP